MASSVIHSQKLPPGSKFSDSFWDDQNKGVEIIMSRLRKSKDTCEEIKKMYELRANIEQDYGERLLKLAQSSRVGDFEEDSFAETLSRIPSALETTARAHIDLAQQLKHHLELPLDGFLKEQRDVRKVQQQQIENSRQLKNLHEADVARARDYYSVECTKLASLEQYYFGLGDESTKEELIKIEKEIEEQRRMVAVADQVYRRSVDNYNSVNERWVNDWTRSADVFQDMEVKRIDYLRSTLWSFANMMTSTFSIDEECCDRIRTALEITDVQKDVVGFVQRYGTGTRIPAPLSYDMLHQPNPMPLTKLSALTNVPESTTSPTTATAATAAAVGVASTAVAATAVAASAIHDHDSELDMQQPLSAPLPQTSVDSLHEGATQGASESNAAALKKLPPQPVTVLTNPDEELKSVDRQLQQLEVLNTTPHSEEGRHSFMQHSPQQLTPHDSSAVPAVVAVAGATAATAAVPPQVIEAEKPREVENKVEQQDESQQPMSAPPLSGVTNTTDQSVGPVSTAIKEVEQILNQKSFDDIVGGTNATSHDESNKNDVVPKTRNVVSSRASYASNNQTIPPIMMARSIYSDNSNTLPAAVSSSPVIGESSDDFSAGIYDALGIKHTSQYDLSRKETSNPVQLQPLSPSDTNLTNMTNNSNPKLVSKYKPMPNPVYNNGSSIEENAPVNGTTNEMTDATPETVPNQKPTVGVRTSSLISNSRRPGTYDNNKSTLTQEVSNDDSDEEDKEYQSRMPRPPPKDEKWVISSIRRPQQLPVRTLNARMFDGTASVSRNSVVSTASPKVAPAVVNENTSPNIQQQHQQQPDAGFVTPQSSSPIPSAVPEDSEEVHKPKVHRPAIPLTIDIPNSVKPTPDLPQNAAQQVIAEGRRLSQMSPVQQKMDLNNTVSYNQPQQMDRNAMRGYITQNGMEDGGIRPAPWQDEMSAEDNMMQNGNKFRSSGTPNNNGYYGNGYQPGMPGPRGSSLKLSNPDLHHQHQMQMQLQQQQQQQQLWQNQSFEEEDKKKFGKNSGKSYNESSVKSKEKDGKGRFSLGFFTGNKKEKKKEKEKEKAEAAAAAAAAAATAVSYSQTPTPEQQQYIAQQQQMHQQQQQQLLQQQQQQQYMMQQQRPVSQQAMHQKEYSQSDLKSNKSNNNSINHSSEPQVQQQQQQQVPAPVPQQPQEQPSFEGSRFIGYAKSNWPFEATIDVEMSFHAEEVLGIIRKQTDGWWEAERLEPAFAGQRGLVPGNYMVEATHPSP